MAVALPVGEGWKEGYESDLNIIHKCYCPNCKGSNGTTTMLPTRIPNFREIYIMSLTCDECNFRNSEVSFGGEIQIKGEQLTLTLTSSDDLNRQIIKSDSATLSIPHLELEFPRKGSVSTIEGFLRQAANDLEALQPDRLRLGDVDNFHRCRNVIEKVRILAGDNDPGEEHSQPIFPFDIVLDDPAGNSFIENPGAPKPDPNIKSAKYFRTPTQDMSLGLQPSADAVAQGHIDDSNPQHKNPVNSASGTHVIDTSSKKASTTTSNNSGTLGSSIGGVGREEALNFQTTCSHCYKPAETSMCVTDIPHFKEVIIMSLLCDHCGYKSNEIKGGGAIPKFGTKITVRVETDDDLAREVLKSDTAGIAIPELDLELEEGGLDGIYTTIEGLIQKMQTRLREANPFGSGDAAKKQHLNNDGGVFSNPNPNHVRYAAFLQRLKDMGDGKLLPFTIIMSDPLSNSFVGPVPEDALALSLQAEREGNHSCYDAYVDPRMDVEEYERSHDQNEILGLNDMKTENYDEGVTNNYYGTDNMEDLPDRIRRADVRGPDHPHDVGKAPVEGDTTVMGAKSSNFAVPSMLKRGTTAIIGRTASNNGNLKIDRIDSTLIHNILHDQESKDKSFMMNEDYEGPKEGLVYKDGAQGIGYYSNVPLLELWEKYHK